MAPHRAGRRVQLLQFVIVCEFSSRLVDGFLTLLSGLLVPGGHSVEELTEFRPKAVNERGENKIRGHSEYRDNNPRRQSPCQQRPEPGDFSNDSSEHTLHDLYLYAQ